MPDELQQYFSDNDQPTYAKVGLYGAAGTGKTRVAYEFASGLHKEKKFTKPVVFFDTEKGSDWVLPLFDKAEIKCFVKKSRTFTDLMDAVKIAEEHASIMIIDSVSHVWRELCNTFLEKLNKDRRAAMTRKYSKDWVDKNFADTNKLEFHHWAVIKPTWAKFTDAYLNSHLHIIVCGRAGDMYEYQENDSGKKELIRTGTKMATEKELAYEPSLLIELQRDVANDTLVAVVEKDRSDTINAKRFEYISYKDIKPHIDFIDIGGSGKNIDLYANKSDGLFEGKTIEPADDFAIEKRKRVQICEKIWGLFEMKLPGRTDEVKKKKLEMLENIFGTVSKTEIENMSSTKLGERLDRLKMELESDEIQ